MTKNFDTQVNPFNAYGPPAFQFTPAAPSTNQLCANCGITRTWAEFNFETGDYVCGTCAQVWAVNGGVGQPSDAVIPPPDRFQKHNEGSFNVLASIIHYGEGIYGNGVYGTG